MTEKQDDESKSQDDKFQDDRSQDDTTESKDDSFELVKPKFGELKKISSKWHEQEANRTVLWQVWAIQNPPILVLNSSVQTIWRHKWSPSRTEYMD